MNRTEAFQCVRKSVRFRERTSDRRWGHGTMVRFDNRFAYVKLEGGTVEKVPLEDCHYWVKGNGEHLPALRPAVAATTEPMLAAALANADRPVRIVAVEVGTNGSSNGTNGTYAKPVVSVPAEPDPVEAVVSVPAAATHDVVKRERWVVLDLAGGGCWSNTARGFTTDYGKWTTYETTRDSHRVRELLKNRGGNADPFVLPHDEAMERLTSLRAAPAAPPAVVGSSPVEQLTAALLVARGAAERAKGKCEEYAATVEARRQALAEAVARAGELRAAWEELDRQARAAAEDVRKVLGV